MAKGQMRSNREAKKPKQTTKAKPAPSGSAFSTDGVKSAPAGSKKK
jgi:hypothetical protein